MVVSSIETICLLQKALYDTSIASKQMQVVTYQTVYYIENYYIENSKKIQIRHNLIIPYYSRAMVSSSA